MFSYALRQQDFSVLTFFGFAFLVPAHPGSPGKRAVKRVCVCVCVCVCVRQQDKDFKFSDFRTTRTTVLRPLYRLAVTPPVIEQEDFVGAKFYCPHVLADFKSKE